MDNSSSTITSPPQKTIVKSKNISISVLITDWSKRAWNKRLTLIETILSASICFFSWFMLYDKAPRSSLDCSPLGFCQCIKRQTLNKIVNKKIAQLSNYVAYTLYLHFGETRFCLVAKKLQDNNSRGHCCYYNFTTNLIFIANYNSYASFFFFP